MEEAAKYPEFLRIMLTKYFGYLKESIRIGKRLPHIDLPEVPTSSDFIRFLKKEHKFLWTFFQMVIDVADNERACQLYPLESSHWFMDWKAMDDKSHPPEIYIGKLSGGKDCWRIQ